MHMNTYQVLLFVSYPVPYSFKSIQMGGLRDVVSVSVRAK